MTCLIEPAIHEPQLISKATLICTSFCLLTVLQTGSVQEEFYKDSDLALGTEVNVWGRRVLLTDCDNFTKEYYRSKYGIGKFNTLL